MLYIQNLLKTLGLQKELSHILVQTAYCNSTVTKFLNENNINTKLVKTGVKFAHLETVKYDIGAADEPNGHGCVAYNRARLEKVLAGNSSIAA